LIARGKLMPPRKRYLSVLLAGLMMLPACAGRKPGDPLKPGYNVYSKEQDIQLGQEAAAQIKQQANIVQNSALQEYVNRIGQRLASAPEADGYPYSFTVINEPGINAFALPGGPIFVHADLIEAADNEAQVAGVMAHEIAHVALRHGTNQASKSQLIQLPAVLAGAVIGDGSLLGQLGQLGLGLGVNSILLRYSRDAETEADALGARLMAEAGYNPIEMARFFEKLEAEGGSRAPQFLSSHPNPGNRMKAVEAEIQTLPQHQYGFSVGSFQQMKTVAAKLPEPKQRPQQQAASASAGPPPAPTGGFQTYQADRFALAYPRGWETFGDRQSRVLTIAPRQGLVQTASGGVSLGYGAVLSYFTPNSRNLSAATNELIAQLRQANTSMRATGQRQVNVAGNPGLLTNMVSASPYGGTERDVVLTVMRPEGLFYMVFVSPEQSSAQLGDTFNQMLQSIRFN